MSGLDELLQVVDLLPMELRILEEYVHTVETIHGRRILKNIRPVSDSIVLGTVEMHGAVLTCQKSYQACLHHNHQKCDEEAESAEVLRQP